MGGEAGGDERLVGGGGEGTAWNKKLSPAPLLRDGGSYCAGGCSVAGVSSRGGGWGCQRRHL